MIKVAFPTDEHFPYEDPRARALALEIVADFDPDLRITGSDGMDFYRVSHFDVDPARLHKGGLQREINLWKAGQREWRDASPNATVKWLLGNHEDRLRKYLWRHPELHDLEVLALPNLLGFAELGIEPEVFEEILVGRELLVRHGEVVRKHSAYSAHAELEKEGFSISVLTGHTHRGGSHYVKTRAGVVQAHECFCLCQLTPHYMRNPNWQNGIVLASVTRDGAVVEPVLFHQTRGGHAYTIWRGKEYRA